MGHGCSHVIGGHHVSVVEKDMCESFVDHATDYHSLDKTIDDQSVVCPLCAYTHAAISNVVQRVCVGSTPSAHIQLRL